VLALSLIGLIDPRRRGQVAWWWLVALAFTLLALGPQLQIDGQVLGLSLPYGWLSALVPLFAITGIPGRFVVMTSLALAVLAAYGLAGLVRWLGWARAAAPRQHRRARPELWLAAGLGLWIGLEYLAVPLRLSRTELADFYHVIAADQEAYAILDIKWDTNFLLHAQTVHHKPLIGGWLARLPETQAAYLDEDRLDRAFLHLLLGPEAAAAPDPATVQSAIQTALAERQVRYIIDHNRTAGPWLEQFVGWPVVFEEASLVVYGKAQPD
jgi:hypothetical protein